MPDGNLQEHRNESRECNEHILFDNGFNRVGNSSLYKKGNYCKLDEKDRIITITSKNDASVSFNTELIDMDKARDLLANKI